MSIAETKSLGEIIKEEMKARGINGSAVARKMNVARQVINQIERRKKFDLEFLQNFKAASGLDYTRFANSSNLQNLLAEDEGSYSKSAGTITLTLSINCSKESLGDFNKFLQQVENAAKNFNYRIV